MCKHFWLRTQCCKHSSKLTGKHASFKWKSISVKSVSSSSFGLALLTKRCAEAVTSEDHASSSERWQMKQNCTVWEDPDWWQRQIQGNCASDKLFGRLPSLLGWGARWQALSINVFKGTRLIHPGAPSALTSAFHAVQLSHPERLILSFDLFIVSAPLANRKLHKEGAIPPAQEHHRTPKGAHTAWLQ